MMVYQLRFNEFTQSVSVSIVELGSEKTHLKVLIDNSRYKTAIYQIFIIFLFYLRFF